MKEGRLRIERTEQYDLKDQMELQCYKEINNEEKEGEDQNLHREQRALDELTSVAQSERDNSIDCWW